MKVKIGAYLCLFVISIAAFYACRRDFINPDKPSQAALQKDLSDPKVPMSIPLGKYYYKDMIKREGKIVRPSARVVPNKKVNKKYALFSKAVASENARYTYLEMPLVYNQRSSLVVTENDAHTTNDVNQKTLRASFDRLVIFKNKTTGKVSERIVTYLPDASSIGQFSKDVKSNRTSQLDTRFSGWLVYSKWDGTRLYAIKVKDGKPLSKLRFGTRNRRANLNANKEVCILTHWIVFEVTCWTESTEEGETEVCEWIPTGEEWDEIECYDDGEDNPDPGCYEDDCEHDPGEGGGDDGGGAPTELEVNIEGEKVDPKEETKCFDKTQPATMTICVQQPNPGTRDLTGPNQIGHCFVSITQGGITRSLGFYPNSPGASVITAQPSEIHDNSGTMYNVGITKPLTAAELSAVITYMNNYPKQYFLNDYNCADFAITVAGKGGLTLPATEKSYLLFHGRNPGDLGEDMRNMSLPSGCTRTTTTTNAPAKNGTCP